MASRCFVLIIVAIAFASPAKAQSRVLGVAECTVFGASELMLALDAMQTIDIQRNGHVEANRILGDHPSDMKIVAYFGGIMAANAALFEMLPPMYRTIAPLVLLVTETVIVTNNRSYGIGLQTPAFRF